MTMPTKKTRLSVTLGRPLYEAIRWLARRDGTSVSRKARDLLRDALAVHEDVALAQIAARRDMGTQTPRTLAHDAVWRPGKGTTE
jgi:plasmid stability protein